MVTEDTLRPEKSHQCRSLYAHGSLLSSNPSARFRTLPPRAGARRSPRAGGAAPPCVPPPGCLAGRAHAPPQPSLRLRKLSRPEGRPHPYGSLFLQPDLHSRENRRTPLAGSRRFTPTRARKVLLARLVSRTQTICRMLGRKLGASEATV